MIKNLPTKAEDTSSIPGLGKSPGEENDNPLEYFCLGNPMNRGAWQATVHGLTTGQTSSGQERNSCCPSLPIPQKSKCQLLSCVRLFATPWTVAHQAPPFLEFSRQEYWSGLPFPSPGDLPDPGIKSRSPVLQADALPSEPQMSNSMPTVVVV